MAHNGALLLIESCTCSAVLLITPDGGFSNLEYGISFQVVALGLAFKRDADLGSLWQEL